MKVYLELPVQSRALQRVYDALIRYAPSHIEVVKWPNEADLIVLHVVGRNDATEKKVNWAKEHKKQYAMIQYCLKSTMKPNTTDWFEMWNDSQLVWSYYDLNQLIYEDSGRNPDSKDFLVNFYHAPLGVDTDIFYDRKSALGHDDLIIVNHSQDYLQESTKECVVAANRLNKKMLYLGEELNRGENILCRTNLTNNELAYAYSSSLFVSGLRRTEGFEMPVIEGAACGARPIVFDRPEMRKWFNEFALFIPEEPREKVIERLVDIFESGENSDLLDRDEVELIKERFNWETIIQGFWEGIV